MLESSSGPCALQITLAACWHLNWKVAVSSGKAWLPISRATLNKCAPLTLLAMERRERRRKASSKASTVVETKTEAGRKPAKLVLKASSALSPRGETDINVLHA